MNFRKSLFSFSLILTFLNTYATPISGDKIIGSGGYATFTDAINDMVTNNIDGPIRFIVRSGNYPEQVIIPFITGANAANTITFEAENPGRDNVILTFSASDAAQNHVVLFDQAHYVKFDGITINSTGLIYQTGISIANGSRHISIENCFLNSPDVSAPAAVEAEVIKINADATPTDDITIRNNHISGGETGLKMLSDLALPTFSTGFTVEDNHFLNNGSFGIIAQNVNNIKISRNKIVDSDLATILSNTTGEVYFNNNIIDFSTAGGNGIIVQSHTIGPAKDEFVYVYNNIINVKDAYALSLTNAVGVKVAFNTMRSEKVSGGSSATFSANFSDTLKFTDNIIQNIGDAYAIFIDNSMEGSLLDRNIYHSAGASPYFLDVNPFSNLADWRAILGAGQETNSSESSVDFIDTENFMLRCNTSTTLKNSIPAATPPPEIDKDINGVTREASCWPGAVELVVPEDNLVTVSGFVTDGTDTLKAGAVIAFVDSSSREMFDRVGTAAIRADGSFTFTDVPALPMYIWIIPSEDGYIKSFHDGIIRRENSTPFDPDNCSGIDLDIFPRKIEPFVFDGTGLISGIVTIGGGTSKTYGTDPIPGLDVVLDRIPPSKTVANTTTDEFGFYSFGNLPDGNYVVTIEYEGLEADTMYDIDVVAGDSIFEDKDYCIDTMALISNCDAPTSIKDIKKDNNLNVFPNPFTNELNVSFYKNIDRVRIFDIRGLIIYDEKPNGNSITINTDNLVPTMYLIEFHQGDERTVKRVIKH